jgi:hypothetical protein
MERRMNAVRRKSLTFDDHNTSAEMNHSMPIFMPAQDGRHSIPVSTANTDKKDPKKKSLFGFGAKKTEKKSDDPKTMTMEDAINKLNTNDLSLYEKQRDPNFKKEVFQKKEQEIVGFQGQLYPSKICVNV